MEYTYIFDEQSAEVTMNTRNCIDLVNALDRAAHLSAQGIDALGLQSQISALLNHSKNYWLSGCITDFASRSVGDVRVVYTPEAIDVANVREFLGALVIASYHSTVVVVDMTATAFIDSVGLLPLVWMSYWLQATGRELRIVCLGHARSMMALTKDDQRLQIFTNIVSAVNAIHQRQESGLTAA